MPKAVDFFGGCGGAASGFRAAGYDTIGVEVWDAACQSQWEAGHRCLKADIRTVDPDDFEPIHHAHFSPPCPTFSSAGNGQGRKHIADIADAVLRVLRGQPHNLEHADEMSLLTLEPARFLAKMRPQTISFEQVRSVLPIWETYAIGLRDLGYSVWTGLIAAETLGVPQTRTRAWLMARRDGRVQPPPATHSRFHPRSPQRLDDGVAKWVSMAEALGWEPGYVAGFPRRADSDDIVTIDGVDYRARDLRPGELPAFALTEKARSWLVSRRDSDGWVASDGPRRNRASDQPAPTITGEAFRWAWKLRTGRDVRDDYMQTRDPNFPAPTVSGQSISWTWIGPGRWNPNLPATTVAGDPRISNRSHHYHGEQGRGPVSSSEVREAFEADRQVDDIPRSMRLEIPEALVLQGFPADYPLVGTRTAQFKQIGNAVPPPVATAVIRALTEGGET